MALEKEIKSFQLELKDLNDSTGEVAFYFAAWTKDLDGDTILKTAYNKTLTENKSNIYHNRDHEDAVGKPKDFGVDDKGAFCVSQMALKTIDGNDCYEQYKAGLIKGHSQEFNTIKSTNDAIGDRVIQEVRLWGVTSVTNIPANLNTPTLSIKSFNDASTRLKSINDLLHNGNISDKCGELFLKEYNRLNEWIESKSKMMGFTHCEGCKSIFVPEADTQMPKCPKCGKYMNQGKSASIFTEGMAKDFRNICNSEK